jgi:Fic family protein
MYVRKEALLSSQIEGTQSSLSDLLLFENHEAPAVELDDVTEVSNYVAAIEHGVSRMRGGFPLSLRLIRGMHAMLLKSGRGAAKQPGEFRRSQNWIGGTRPSNALFVPPPPNRLDECLDALERFRAASVYALARAKSPQHQRDPVPAGGPGARRRCAARSRRALSLSA